MFEGSSVLFFLKVVSFNIDFDRPAVIIKENIFEFVFLVLHFCLISIRRIRKPQKQVWPKHQAISQSLTDIGTTDGARVIWESLHRLRNIGMLTALC